MNKPIFMDYHSTTPMDPRVVETVLSVMTAEFGNASSVDHVFGARAAHVVESARERIAELVNTKKAKIVFTSGATEALNLVIQNFSGRGSRLAVSEVEHIAVLETCQKLSKVDDIQVDVIKVDRVGRIDLLSLERMLEEGLDLVCVMAANNEVGTVNPICEIARLCKQAQTHYLCDASQAAGKIEIMFDDWNLDFLVMSAHKMYGPKGIGALVTRRELLPKPILSGGAQEFGSRPGTLNVPAIAGFGEASRLRKSEMKNDELDIAVRRDHLEMLLKAGISGMHVNGDIENRLAGNLHISVPDVPNDAVICRIRDKLGISRGASCSSGIEKPSHVLKAIGLTPESIEGAFRIGIGKFTTDEEIDQAAHLLIETISSVRSELKSLCAS